MIFSQKLIKKLAKQGRKILFFLDNVSSHPLDLVGKFSHYKGCFSSKEYDILSSTPRWRYNEEFKVRYRKLVVKHALDKINGTSLSATQISKSIDILTAVCWVKQAWDQVKTTTIVNCFKHCGFNQTEDLTTDPFADLSEADELQDLVQSFSSQLSATEYLHEDENVETSITVESIENWMEELRSMVLYGDPVDEV